jgi:hypothetical protein
MSALALAAVVAAPLTACTQDHTPPPPVDAQALSLTAANHVQELVHQAGAGIGFAGDSGSTAQKILGGSGMPSMPVMPTSLMPSMMTGAMAAMTGAAPAGATNEQQADDLAARLKAYITDRLLTDANLESTSADNAVYLLHGDPTCRPLPADGDPPGTLPPVDATCQQRLDALQVRLVVAPDGDGVKVSLVLGPDGIKPSTLTIHSDLLQADGDLAQGKRAIDYVNATLGQGSPMASSTLSSTSATLSGRVRYALHKDGDRKVTLAFSLLDDLDVAEADAAGHTGLTLHTAARDPLLSLSGDGAERTLAIAVNIGATDIRGPWDPNGGAGTNTDLHLSLGGLTAATTLADGQNGSGDGSIDADFGIGDTFVDVRGMRIFDLGLNPDAMRMLHVHATTNAAGLPRLEITPKFDLTLGYHLGAVAADYVTPPSSYLLDDSYRFLLSNGGAAAVIEAVQATASGFAGGLKLTAGSLVVSHDKAAGPVTVPQGKCLTTTQAAPGADPVLGQLVVTDCP